MNNNNKKKNPPWFSIHFWVYEGILFAYSFSHFIFHLFYLKLSTYKNTQCSQTKQDLKWVGRKPVKRNNIMELKVKSAPKCMSSDLWLLAVVVQLQSCVWLFVSSGWLFSSKLSGRWLEREMHSLHESQISKIITSSREAQVCLVWRQDTNLPTTYWMARSLQQQTE